MHERDVDALRLGPIDLQWRYAIEIVIEHDENNVSQKGASRQILKGPAWKNFAGTDVLVPRRKMQTFGGRMTQPVRPFNTC